MREIVLDTETTGLDPSFGHRIVEIGCVELFNRLPTGEVFHVYINPDRSMPEAAFNIHGLSSDFLKTKPVFSEVVNQFLEFIKGSPLIIHNAAFDLAFINAELTKLKKPSLNGNKIIDTIPLAKKKFPGAPVNLDALCRKFHIDLTKRDIHGALLDANLLASVYLELIGGRQQGFLLTETKDTSSDNFVKSMKVRPSRLYEPNKEEKRIHINFIKKLNNSLWLLFYKEKN